MPRTFSRREFGRLVKDFGIMGGFMALGLRPPARLGKVALAQPLEDPNAPSIAGLLWNTGLPTTLQRTIADITPQGLRYGPGEPPVLRNELAPGFAGFDGKELYSLGVFLHITDTHATDEESPQTLHYRRFAGHSPQILDAHVSTVRQIASQIKLDFVLHTGDATESAQENELEWFLGVMDGGEINPNSGAPVEPGGRFAGPENQPFQARGLGETPWYFTMGNHDELVMGSLTPTEAFNELAIGGFAPIGYSTPLPFEAPFIGNTIPLELQGAPIAPDPKRRILSREEFLGMVLASPTMPKGHGYSIENIESGVRLYTVHPLPGVPLRLIGIDTASPIGYSLGSIRQETFELLKESLDEAKQDGLLVILATHHPSGSITDLPPLEGLRSKNGRDLIGLLNGYPNVLTHIAGHTHVNTVLPKDTYYEIQTCAVIDPPHQTRLIELIWDGGENLGLATVMVDFEEGHEVADQGRALAFNDPLAGGSPGSALDRNTLLMLGIPADIQERLRSAKLEPPRLLRRA